MSAVRLIALLGCALAIACGLAALALPAQASLLALGAALCAGLAMAALFLSREAASNPDADLSRVRSPASLETLEPSEPPISESSLEKDEPTDELLAELERYKALEQELTQAKQEAEAATMAKGEFLATMSHEIRTPLNGVIPLLDLMLSTPLNADQRDYIGTAYNSARQLLRIVDDILDYSKLDANKLQLENVGINLRELCSGVLRLLEKSAEAKGLRLGLEIDPGVRLAARGDPVRLRQVLTNLLSNAIKFTEQGGVTLHLRRIGETRTQNLLRFEVIDSGIGIAPEAAQNLFQPFSQADASTTRTFGGTGLGLAICKRIITLMGGSIGVESTLGKGSTFWFELSLDKAIGDIDTGSVDAAKALQALLVSANPAQQKRLSLTLRQWGLNVIQAGNTQDALATLRSQQHPGQHGFDLVLADAASIPTTLLALHRSLMREPRASRALRVYLVEEDTLPPEITQAPDVRVLPRSSSDTELRSRIMPLLEARLKAGDSVSETSATEVVAPESASGNETGGKAATSPHTSPVPAGNGTATPSPAFIPKASVTSQDMASSPERPQRVLLVEDNPVNRQVAQKLLSLAGIAFDSAENGREALEKMAAHEYSAVLMDCQMPVLDGYSATRQRRQWEAANGLRRLPIIAMTANVMLGDREKCLDAGMDDYLGKPLNRALLESTLLSWMKGRPAADVLPSQATPDVRDVPPSVASPPVACGIVTNGTTPAPATGPAVDRSVLGELRQVMGPEFGALIKVFLDDAPRLIERIQSQAAQGDLAGIVTPAHTLKSTSANLGARNLSGLARTLELGARRRHLPDAQELAAALNAEYERVANVLRPHQG